ncbi:hypothetical protein VNO77_05569 [Canavalia gladiata]|uniref:Uncharacterized protein n=1 Tax=Canavalia gladiata TaxID=3824 RepID=A0AAN9R8U3_CANGL
MARENEKFWCGSLSYIGPGHSQVYEWGHLMLEPAEQGVHNSDLLCLGPFVETLSIAVDSLVISHLCRPFVFI